MWISLTAAWWVDVIHNAEWAGRKNQSNSAFQKSVDGLAQRAWPALPRGVKGSHRLLIPPRHCPWLLRDANGKREIQVGCWGKFLH